MGQQWLVAAGAVISARGVNRRKLVGCRLIDCHGEAIQRSYSGWSAACL